MEDANIKLDSVVTDIIGMTGRAMLAALTAEVCTPASWLRPPTTALRRRRADCARRCAAGS